MHSIVYTRITYNQWNIFVYICLNPAQTPALKRNAFHRVTFSNKTVMRWWWLYLDVWTTDNFPLGEDFKEVVHTSDLRCTKSDGDYEAYSIANSIVNSQGRTSLGRVCLWLRCTISVSLLPSDNSSTVYVTCMQQWFINHLVYIQYLNERVKGKTLEI